MDSQAVTRELAELISTKADSDKIFDMSPDDFRTKWAAAKQQLGLAHLGPPHDLRHGGASRDVEAGTRSLEQVRRRGRWKQLSSVQRYTKTWVLVRERARLTAEQLDRAATLIKERSHRNIAE